MHDLDVSLRQLPIEWAADAELEALTFQRAFGNTPELLRAEYDPYLEQTVFISVRDVKFDRPLACMRIIRPGLAGLKSVNDLDGSDWGRTPSLGRLRERAISQVGHSELWDVATFSADRSTRSQFGSRPMLAALHALYRISRVNGVREWIAILDLPVLRLLRQLGLPLTALPGCEAAPYLGSDASLPTQCTVEQARAGVDTVGGERAQALRTGDGIGVRVPADSALKVR